MIIALKKTLAFLIISFFLVGCDYKLRSSYQGLNDLVVSLYFNENNLNQEFASTLKRQSGLRQLYLNKETGDTDLKGTWWPNKAPPHNQRPARSNRKDNPHRRSPHSLRSRHCHPAGNLSNSSETRDIARKHRCRLRW